MYKRGQTESHRPLKQRYKPRIVQREKLRESRIRLVAVAIALVIIVVFCVTLLYRPVQIVRLRSEGSGLVPEMVLDLQEHSEFRLGVVMNENEKATSHKLAFHPTSAWLEQPCLEVLISPQLMEVGSRGVDSGRIFEMGWRFTDPYDWPESMPTTPISPTTPHVSLQVFDWAGYVDTTSSLEPQTDIIASYELEVHAERAHVMQRSYYEAPIVLEFLELTGGDTRIDLSGTAPNRFFAQPVPNSTLVGHSKGSELVELWTFEKGDVIRGQIEPPDQMTATCTCLDGCQVSVVPGPEWESERLLDTLFLTARLRAERLFIKNAAGELAVGRTRISLRQTDSVEIRASLPPHAGLVGMVNLRESMWPERNWWIDMDARSNYVLLNGEQVVPTLWDQLHEDMRRLLTTLLVSAATAWFTYELRERLSWGR